MSNLKIKKFFEKITTSIYKNKLRGATVKLGGIGSTELAFDSSATTTGSTYVSIMPQGILDTNFVYSTNNSNVYGYSTHASSTTSVKYPQITIKQAGLYLVEANVYFANSYTANDAVYITIYVNNAIPDNRYWFRERMSSTSWQVGQLVRLIYLNKNDVVQMRVSNYTSATRGKIYLNESTELRLTLMNPTL